MELNLVCPHCRAEIPFRKPFVFIVCPECAKKLTMTNTPIARSTRANAKFFKQCCYGSVVF